MRKADTHSLSILSILIHSVQSSSLPFQPDRDLVIKYALSNQERGGGNADRGVSLQHCSLQYSSNIPIARTGKDI